MSEQSSSCGDPPRLFSHVVVGRGGVCALLDDSKEGWHAGRLDKTHLGVYPTQPTPQTAISELEYLAAAAVAREWCQRYGMKHRHETCNERAGVWHYCQLRNDAR